MIFSIKNLNIFILSTLMFFGNIVKSEIIFPDIDKIKGEYKKEISDAISREKKLRYAAVGIPGYLLLTSWLKKKEPVLKLEAKDFDENKIKILNDLLGAFAQGKVIIMNDTKAQGLEFIMIKFIQFFNSLKSTIGSVISSTTPLILVQYMDPALRWLLLSYDIKWITNKYNLINLLNDLKLNAVYLDAKSPVLNIDNKITITDNSIKDRAEVSIQFPATYFDEIIKLKVTAQGILSRQEMNQITLDEQIRKVENLSNKFVTSVLKVISYLYYQEEVLLKSKSLEKSKEFGNYANSLVKLTNEYCSVIKDALEKYSTNTTDNKNILTTIFEFSNLFNQIVFNISKI